MAKQFGREDLVQRHAILLSPQWGDTTSCIIYLVSDRLLPLNSKENGYIVSRSMMFTSASALERQILILTSTKVNNCIVSTETHNAGLFSWTTFKHISHMFEPCQVAYCHTLPFHTNITNQGDIGQIIFMANLLKVLSSNENSLFSWKTCWNYRIIIVLISWCTAVYTLKD